ncbi:YceI family protein [Leptospira gomenensis]|uniref:YceI family protein n=1 Tax=Leptospira gomenensis TaxID=2484974 RepID=A0A5F1Z0Z6_9LEPT|nr:YceI family protein [Leptospira gomenensis]TGK29026.1 YceI family protein [Leptospira gomenensis]TGK44993.1 YceI family protein [Leptospira gomenensis]TGK51870.1 YceI family protein [Leptospira gomenensis]TGK67322.1 YceI family protein [Leptospira gomenensis]
MNFRKFIYYFLLILVSLTRTVPSADLSAQKKDAEEWTVKEAEIRFLSEAPQETIRGILHKAEGKADLKTKKFFVNADLNDLNVPNKLMNGHMHENYLETDRFPAATFHGSIVRYDRASKTVVVEGDFTLHGVVKKNLRVQGSFEEREKDLLVRADFEILLTDFKIEIPKLVILKLNEKIKIETSILWTRKE